MIVPENRMLLLVGASILPASLAAAAVPAATLPALAICAAVVLICVVDALFVAGKCSGIRVDFPEKVNVIRNREESLIFKIREEKGSIGKLLLAIGFPCEVASVQEELPVEFPQGAGSVQVTWPITANRRGEYGLSGCLIRVHSRLGLWSKQENRSADTRIHVYPDLMKEQQKITALFLRRNTPGLRAQRQVGRGREFEMLRDYIPGDSMSDIHWRVTAKRGHLVTKEYQIERTQEVYVIIDASRLSARMIESNESGIREPILERHIGAALTLGDFAQRQGDKFGLIVFSNRILNFLRAGSNRAHFRLCRDSLLTLDPQTVTPDFEEVAAAIMKSLRRRALLLFLTCLDDPSLAESFVESMEAVGRKHLMTVNMIRPASAIPLFSDPGIDGVDDIYRALGGHMVHQSLRELEIVLRRRGIGFYLLDHERLSVEMVSQYINVKRRQIL